GVDPDGGETRRRRGRSQRTLRGHERAPPPCNNRRPVVADRRSAAYSDRDTPVLPSPLSPQRCPMRPMPSWVVRSCLGLVLLTAAAAAGEVGFVEDFALSPDRAAALRQLVPGTEDYYYYHGLHYLNSEQ